MSSILSGIRSVCGIGEQQDNRADHRETSATSLPSSGRAVCAACAANRVRIVLYESGRQIRLLRLSDGYDAIIAQGRFERKYQQFPILDAAIDRVGLLYAVSTSSNGDYSWPYGDGTISFVTSEALERALP